MVRLKVGLFLITGIVWPVVNLVASDGLRIETTFYVGDEEIPVSRNLTLFQTGIVYDVLFDPLQVAVFKISSPDNKGHFVLLNPQKQLRTKIDMKRILEFLPRLKAWSESQADPLLKFAANPDFEEQFDAQQRELRLDSEVLSYHVLASKPKDLKTLALYHQFSDWCARLSVLTDVGALPPFPRLAVNSALSRYQIVPQTVQVRIPAYKPFRKQDVVIRSKHEIQWRLSKQDRQRIDKINTDLVTFEKVSYENFRSGNH